MTRLLDTVGSIWFGVALLVLIFLYASIGSAVPLVRQGYLADYLGLECLRFEKSEQEWFGWWPFGVLIAIFCLSIVLVTIRRIRPSIINAGVWAIHTGIVVMSIACAYYFGTKVEGDTMIFVSRARIRAPGAAEAGLVIRPGAETTITGDANHYRLRVVKIDPEVTPTSGPRQGKRSQQVWISVASMNPPRSFVRTMIVGDPAGTEDLILGNAGIQSALEATGERLVDKDLQILLDFDPVEYFYRSHELPVRSNGAIYVRPVGVQEWTELRVDWLPHYFEHLAHRDELWLPEDEQWPPLRPLDLPARAAALPSWLSGVAVRVTDYLPYARREARFIPAGADAPLNPLLRLRLGAHSRSRPFELLAADPNRSRLSLMQNLSLRFTWATSAEERARLLQAATESVEPGLLFVAGPGVESVDALLLSSAGVVHRAQGSVGDSLDLLPAVPIRIEALLPRVREEARPAIISTAARQVLLDQGKRPSMLRVEINDGQRIHGRWLEFNEYPFPDAQRGDPQRTTPFRTDRLMLADGRQLEVMYSRQRERLAAPVMLNEFILETHPGGDSVADFISRVCFKEGDGWSRPVEIRSNQPARHGDYWYFQSKWDADAEAHTVLGVGNRNGVGAMLAGVCISIAGMVYAFYVKPAILRRRKRIAGEVVAAWDAGAAASSGSTESRLAPTGVVPRPPAAIRP